MKAELMGMSAEAREQMVIDLWRSGKTEKEIMQELDCAHSTVKRYLIKNPDYNVRASDERTLIQLTYSLPVGFDWKWAVTCNRLLRAAGKKEQPVPEHSKQAEKRYWNYRERRT